MVPTAASYSLISLLFSTCSFLRMSTTRLSLARARSRSAILAAIFCQFGGIIVVIGLNDGLHTGYFTVHLVNVWR